MGNELVFRAADTATALEKVQDNLGENAFIIEIKNVGNFVEITASLQEPAIMKGAAKTAPKNSVLMLSQQLRENSTPKPQANVENLVPLEELGDLGAPNPPERPVEFNAGALPENDFAKERVEALGPSETSKITEADQESSAPIKRSANETLSKNEIDTDAPELGKATFISPELAPEPTQAKGRDGALSFGDLLNLGLTNDFIKKEFSIAEFSGSISKDHLVNTLVKIFWDANSCRILDVYYNIVLLGTPGSGKSTVCAKLMQHYSLFKDERPRVLQVSPDKLFELERLGFFARLFNFDFQKQSDFHLDAVFNAEKQLSEISWDFFCDFFQALAQQGKHLPHVKLLLVLPASINTASLTEVLRVSGGINSVILNKCDYGRITIKHLMILYQQNCKIVGLSGDTDVTQPMEFVDAATMRAFIEYVLESAH